MTGFFRSSSVAVGSDCNGAGMFSLLSDVNTGCLTGESLTLRFSRFEAAFARVSTNVLELEIYDASGKLTCFEGVIVAIVCDDVVEGIRQRQVVGVRCFVSRKRVECEKCTCRGGGSSIK